MSATTVDLKGTTGWAAQPAWLKWMVYAFGGILLLSVVGAITGTTLLTSSSLISSTLKWSMPILLAGLGGLFAERCGVVNIGLEGMMIMGTWLGAYGALNFGPIGGLLFGMVGGGIGGLLHAVATVQFGVDHIVSGVAINILGLGLPRFLSENVFIDMEGGSATQSPHVDGLGEFTVPFLAGGWGTADILGSIEDNHWFLISDIAGIVRGPMAQIGWFTVLGIALVFVATFVLYKTRAGLRIRIAGERPSAGDSLGVNIYVYKYAGVLVSGAMAGLAGAFIVMELTGFYKEGQTLSRGFIALAALIFGNWSARGVFGGALLFAYPVALSLKDLDSTSVRALLLVIAVALVGIAIWAFKRGAIVDAGLAAVIAVICLVWFLTTETADAWLPNVMPYALVLIVLVFFGQKLRPPASVGLPYRRGDH